MTIAEAVEALQRGDVVGLPTDTVYGIGADAFQEEAYERLFVLKGRAEVKPIPLLVPSAAAARSVATFPGGAEARIAEHWPGALTVVLPRAGDLPPWLGDVEAGTVAVRVPDHGTALDLLEAYGPLAVTSANLAGAPPALDEGAAREVFGSRVAGYVAGTSPGGTSSTVVDLTSDPAVVLRQGPVAWPGLRPGRQA